MSTSGTTAFDPPISDLLIDCFERCGIRSAELTPDHMFSARRSLNLILATWSNRGVNLFVVDQISVPLIQGVGTYSVPSNTIMILDTFIRTYQMSTATNLTPTFATTINTTNVQITYPSSGAIVGGFIQVIVPISIGGIILSGFYQVTSVIDENNFTITAIDTATSSVTGGVVPQFSSAVSSEIITCLFPNHGYLSGDSFVVQVPTLVGGVTLTGTYTITSVIDVNNFTFSSSYPTGAVDTQYENSGLAQIAVQSVSSQPTDRVMGPMSRTDYNSLPNKPQQGFPTIFWFDRLINPTITLWQVPDGSGPYQLFYYRMRQIQDAYAVNGQTPEIPYNALEAFCAGVAFHLSMKWAQEKSVALKAYYDQVWNEFAEENREYVPLRLQPMLNSYYEG